MRQKAVGRNSEGRMNLSKVGKQIAYWSIKRIRVTKQFVKFMSCLCKNEIIHHYRYAIMQKQL